jgi:hypothetical protein
MLFQNMANDEEEDSSVYYGLEQVQEEHRSAYKEKVVGDDEIDPYYDPYSPPSDIDEDFYSA